MLRFGNLLFLVFCLLFLKTTVLSQLTEVRITVLNRNTVRIEGETPNAQRRWVFPSSYAGEQNLTARIERFEIFDKTDQPINFAKSGAGDFTAETAANRWRSDAKLDFPAKAANAAHISWLGEKNGLLMLEDLLPELASENGEAVKAKVILSLPANWKVATAENQIGVGEFQTADLKKAIFLIGEFDKQSIRLDETEIQVARIGREWSFTSAETLDLASQILSEYKRLFSKLPANKIQILLVPLEQKFGGESWEAETRGSTIVVLSAVSPFKSRALSQLHEQLRHELFHLWIPNALNLRGDYAWFYEGFALYQAVKTGVSLKYIRFEDFLDVLSRAFDVARKSPQNKTVSLLGASQLRFNLDNAEFVYAKGMIVAFLCDLAILRESSGKKSIADLLSELFRRHQKPNPLEDANQASVALLKNKPELKQIVEKFVETAGTIEWQADLTLGGLQNVAQTSLTRLAPLEKLNGRQKKILAKLGYQTR